jgi:hypothetical protein
LAAVVRTVGDMFYPAAKGRVIAALVTTGAAFRSRWAASERITG